MGHIISYVRRQKNKTFDKMPFNEVDALVLSQFIYLKLDGLVPHFSDGQESIELCHLAGIMEEDKVFADERYVKDNKALFRAMVKSKRFAGMKMNYFSNIVSVLAETQFAAITIFLENGPTVIVFRGTDETMVGWKEDFNMCLKEPVTGQSLSALYLKQVGEILCERFIVAGHSKGGNFSVYAAMNVESDIQDRIINVYSFDGPGFRPEILESVDFAKIRDRIKKYLPHSSVVGMLLQSKEGYRVVESSSIGVMQHNPYNWRIEGNHFKELEDINRGSKFFNETVNEWLFGLEDEQVRAFVEIWYQIVNEAEVTTLLELTREPGKTLLSLLDAIRETDDETRKMAKELAKSLRDIAAENLRHSVRQQMQGIQEIMEKEHGNREAAKNKSSDIEKTEE